MAERKKRSSRVLYGKTDHLEKIGRIDEQMAINTGKIDASVE
jgi:hypothetical protein